MQKSTPGGSGLGSATRPGNVAYEKAYALAMQIVRVSRDLARREKEFDISRQILRCGTSIGANLAEAAAAISDAELSAKVSIAYKECQETRYWLCLLRDCDLLEAPTASSLLEQLEEISRILFATIRTLRIKSNRQQK